MSSPQHPSPADADGPYMVVNIIARRARQINKSHGHNLYDDDAPDPLDVASNEYNNQLLNWEFRQHLIGTGDDFRSTS